MLLIIKKHKRKVEILFSDYRYQESTKTRFFNVTFTLIPRFFNVTFTLIPAYQKKKQHGNVLAFEYPTIPNHNYSNI